MIATNIAIILAIVGLIVGLAIGWDSAIYHNHRVRRTLESDVRHLETEVATLNEKLAEDPQRASIDHGQRYVLNQVQTLLDRIREAIR